MLFRMRTSLDLVVEETRIETRPVSVTVRVPAADPPRAAVVVLPGTAIPQGFYRRFASYLAERGLASVTFDWSGCGHSGDPRANREVRMSDWLDKDAPAVLAWARARFPDLPLVAVGHSLGGHALALGAGGDDLRAAVTVASHAGVTAAIPTRLERLRVGAVLGLLAPTAGRLLGYVPGRKLGLGEDMPTAAMVQWSRWCRTAGYFFDDPEVRAAERMAQVRLPVLAIGLSDDLWATPQQIDQLTDHLTAADVTRRTVTPQDLGQQAVGHMGCFRAAGAGLWPQIAGFLLEHA